MENVPQPGDIGRPDRDPSSPDGYFHGNDGVMNDFADRYRLPEHEPALKGEKDPDEIQKELDEDGPDRPGLKADRHGGRSQRASTVELDDVEVKVRSLLARSDVGSDARLAAVVAAWSSVKSDIANQPSVSNGDVRMTRETLATLLKVMRQIEELDRELLLSVDHEPAGFGLR